MSSFLIKFYLVVLCLALLILVFNLISLRKKKKFIGKIKARWSQFFSLSFPLNRLILAALFAYFLWCVYQIASDPASSNGYHRLMFLIVLLVFTPRWSVYVGSEGIMVRMMVIPWEEVKEKKVVTKGRRTYLVIKIAASSRPSDLETKRIPLPKQAEHVLESLIF